MSGVTAQHTRTNGASPGGPRAFKTTLRARWRGFREETKSGLERGSIWLVRLLEVGRSLNGPAYTEEAVRGAVQVFEGKPVCVYSFDEEPQNGRHLPDEVLVASAPVANTIGHLRDVHYNEQARALDGYLHVYDGKLREKLVDAYKRGHIGENASMDAFGLSIDAFGEQNDSGDVKRFTQAVSVDVVNTPAAGGRFRRLVASLQTEQHQREQGQTEANQTEARQVEQLQTPQEEAVAETNVTESAPEAPQAKPVAAAAEAPAEPASLDEAQGAGTLAGKLQLMAQQLSTAPDDEALEVLMAIKDAVDMAVEDHMNMADAEGGMDDLDERMNEGGGSSDSRQRRRTETVRDKQPQEGTVSETKNDESARLSAGLTDLLRKHRDLPESLREELVTLVGHDVDEDEKDVQIRELREQQTEQAIYTAYARLVEQFPTKDNDLVFSLIDRNAIKVEDPIRSKVAGLKEAFEAVLAAKPYLRADAEQPAAEPAATATPEPQRQQESLQAPAAVRLQEQYREQDAANLQAGGARPSLSAGQLKRLQRRAMNGDMDAVTTLRHARGHRW